MGHSKTGLIRQVTCYKRFNSCEIVYSRTRKSDLLIQVTAYTGDHKDRLDFALYPHRIPYNGEFLFYRFGKNNGPPNTDLRSFLIKQASIPEKRNRDRTSGFYSNW